MKSMTYNDADDADDAAPTGLGFSPEPSPSGADRAPPLCAP